MSGRNLAASVRAKLLNKARAEKRDFTQILTRYALERLLYRLSISEHASQFLLKDALLFDLWFDEPLRPTRDIDLLGFGLTEAFNGVGFFVRGCFAVCGGLAVILKNKNQLIDGKNSAAHQA